MYFWEAVITFLENVWILFSKSFLGNCRFKLTCFRIHLHGRQNNYNKIYQTPAAVDFVINSELMAQYIVTTIRKTKKYLCKIVPN